jgi:hypothetical protein
MSATVYTTAGGRRFHADDSCRALWSAQALSDWDYDYEFPPPAGARLPQQHAIEAQQPLDAARAGYTGCRVCVPPALALPATGETYGHQPCFVCLPDFTKGYGCARCRVRVRVPNWPRSGEDVATGWHHETHAVLWPCTSAVVLGLAPRGGA